MYSFLFGVSLLNIALTETAVIGELSREGIKSKAIKVTDRQISTLERLCRDELAQGNQYKFIQLQIFGEAGGAPLPKPLSGYSFEYWRNFYNKLVNSPNEIAEMISIGNDAVLRVRNRSGHLTRRVLRGKDPLRLEEEEGDLELLHVAIDWGSPYRLSRVDIYARTGSTLGEDTGMRLWKKLRPLFPSFDLFLYIRNDGWFVYESSYPFVNPFEGESPPPSRERYNRTQTLSCGSWEGAPSCYFR
jgi:hypothetical protein